MERAVKLIIPAAGLGMRMGLSYPKTLFPIAGRPVLDYILAASDGLIDTAVVVASVMGKAMIEAYLKSAGWTLVRTVVQEQPIGMADAVSVGVHACGDDPASDYLVIWGDQVTVRRETLARTILRHRTTGAWLTFPTSWRTAPYIHVVRDANGKVRGVSQAREGDTMPTEGESDCGVFLLRGDVLRQGLIDLKARTWDPVGQRFFRLDGYASSTGEFNFLPLIGLWASEGAPVEAWPIAEPEETRGINTQAEAADVGFSLQERWSKRSV